VAGAPGTYHSVRQARVTTDGGTMVLRDVRVTRDSAVGWRRDLSGPTEQVRLARSEVRAFEEPRFDGGRSALAIVAAAGVVLAAIIGGGME